MKICRIKDQLIHLFSFLVRQQNSCRTLILISSFQLEHSTYLVLHFFIEIVSDSICVKGEKTNSAIGNDRMVGRALVDCRKPRVSEVVGVSLALPGVVPLIESENQLPIPVHPIRLYQNEKDETDNELMKTLSYRASLCEGKLSMKEEENFKLDSNIWGMEDQLSEGLSELDIMKTENLGLKKKLQEMEVRMSKLEQQRVLKENQYKEDNGDSISEVKYTHRSEPHTTEATGCMESTDELMIIRDINSAKDWEIKLQNTNQLLTKYSQLNNKVNKIEKDVPGICSLLNEKIEGELKKWPTKQESLEQHLCNIENILFFNHSPSGREMVLQWKLQNYRFLRTAGVGAWSPLFFPVVNGHRIILNLEWKEKNEITLSVFARSSSTQLKATRPFDNEFTLEMHGRIGLVKAIASSGHRDRQQDGDGGESEKSYESHILFAEEFLLIARGNVKLNKYFKVFYVNNDTLSIKFRLKL